MFIDGQNVMQNLWTKYTLEIILMKIFNSLALNIHRRLIFKDRAKLGFVPKFLPKLIHEIDCRTPRKLARCPVCMILVADVERHVAASHVPPPTSGSGARQRRGAALSLRCDVCSKTYHSQREFTNHRRRKDFCKPPAIEAPPAPKRRIGIIRRSL
jgi:uncharacterized protein with PIN domain